MSGADSAAAVNATRLPKSRRDMDTGFIGFFMGTLVMIELADMRDVLPRASAVNESIPRLFGVALRSNEFTSSIA